MGMRENGGGVGKKESVGGKGPSMLANILHQGLIDSLDTTVSNVHASIATAISGMYDLF